MIKEITQVLRKLSKDDKNRALIILQSLNYADWQEVENANVQRQTMLLGKLKEKLDVEFETVQDAKSKYTVTRARDPMKRNVANMSFRIPGFKLK